MKRLAKNITTLGVYSIVCVSVVFGMVTTTSATVQDELWQKAIDITAKNTWIPGHVLQHERVVDKKGKLQEDSESEILLAPGQNGKIAVNIVNAVSNGKDVTDEARKENDGEAESDEIIDSNNPFASDVQENIMVTRLDQQKTIQGKQCIGFQYSLETDSTIANEEKDVSIAGIAWIDEITGVPYEIEMEITSVPFKEDQVTINALKQIDHYNYIDGQWLQTESVLDMDIEVKAFLMKFKGTVNSVSQYSQHWKL